MDYKEFVFKILSAEEYQRDMLIHALGEAGFDTFEETENGFKAYVPEGSFSEDKLKEVLDSFSNVTLSYEENRIPQTNWNAVWESNFEPITIDNSCYVRATFHEPKPEFSYEIVIDPKMAFGTGHHQTTALMMQYMLKEDFGGKAVLDMGCGTGILAILAQKLGATDIVAIDNDEVCYQSTIENAALNKAVNVKAVCGSKEVIPVKKFDIILANINRNILQDQIGSYSRALKPDGLLFMSGFYEGTDLDILIEKAAANNLKFQHYLSSDNWVAAKFVS